MENLEILQEYFTTGTAAQEKDYITEIFVTSNDFKQIITPPSRSMRLLVGSKGSGKSALLEYLSQKSFEQNIPALYLTPVDIEIDSIDENAPSSFIVRKIYEALVKEIAIKIGSTLDDGINDVQEALVKSAVTAGTREPLGIDSLLKIITPIGKAITNIDFDKMLPDVVENTRTFVSAINETLPDKGKVFYVLFDDIDQFGNPSSAKYIDTVWCAILAFKILAEKLPNVRPIVALRNEIWRQINDGRNNSRDQVDHIRSMLYNLTPSSDDIIKILKHRLNVCKAKINGHFTNCFEPFFDGDNCQMPNSAETRLWSDYLATSSRERPRDTVQLVQQLVSKALKSGHSKINNLDVIAASSGYSKERVDDLVNENADMCTSLETIIRSFSDIAFCSDSETVRKHLLAVPGRCKITVQGKTMNAGDTTSMFEIWKLLFKIGFLSARAKDCTMPKGFVHIKSSDDSTLVTEARWNDMQKYEWEIHPCYRSYLQDIRTANKKMVGFR